MPIKIPDQLPAHDILVREGVQVMDERTALRQDIRPLQIGLLNLMPNKIRTETQFARLIGASPLQVELTLVRIGSHAAKNTSEEHLIAFYQTWEEVKQRKFDGFIVTGAPVEKLDFEEVNYWDELTQIFDWTTTNVHSSFFICWGAMAAAWHFHRIPKYQLDKKAFGVFRHKNHAPASPYLTGFSDDFAIPVSRWTEVRSQDIRANPELELLMESEVTGPCMLAEQRANRLYMFNHIEYDSTSLKEEYDRDVATGVPIDVPHEYYPDDDPARPPLNRWRSHAHLLFGNWINQVYQTTTYDLNEIGKGRS
ncbi:homoserine O-acetyltransferase MetA [Aquamicrobium zhengzhouense]|uniref:Homoserine O-acetyltransferase n=1 Tax=Aquamicrobium zhengzhouense TaxID=2781738 RepID=A0ABS0SDU0_9HYPH|nr:homoserine O-succinyltransferase [Aquamicrobium zhengzhouense]MBI1621441.1 homoserine O-succinyltransferase [Aquamicrobium zhengzhouense]